MNDFKFYCPNCGQKVSASHNMLGQAANCPSCKEIIKVPTPLNITLSLLNNGLKHCLNFLFLILLTLLKLLKLAFNFAFMVTAIVISFVRDKINKDSLSSLLLYSKTKLMTLYHSKYIAGNINLAGRKISKKILGGIIFCLTLSLTYVIFFFINGKSDQSKAEILSGGSHSPENININRDINKKTEKISSNKGNNISNNENRTVADIYRDVILGGQNIEAIEKSAKQGNADAQNRLGILYCLKSYSKPGESIIWFTKAAKQGHIKAQYNLARCYYSGGSGATKDYSQAALWYEKSAKQGYDWAKVELGECYLSGKGVPRDPEHAIRLLEDAASQGLLYAKVVLAACYEKGIGVSKDPWKKRKLMNEIQAAGKPALRKTFIQSATFHH